jgi:putative cardiolipin synthase
MRKRIAIAVPVVIAAAWLAVASQRETLPSLAGRTATTVIRDTQNTKLGSGLAPMLAAHPSMSGVYPLRDARDAFAARIVLARAAQRTLDLQYYIWRNDITGLMLFKELNDAADRGVRVRLLLDDNNTAGVDPILAALDAHPNIEVRLINPFLNRKSRWLGYLTDFTRLNRRMHNKSFTADDQATIVGGRNVGDEYFGAASTGPLFADLDVLSAGPSVNDVSDQFDQYWASESAYPVERLFARATPAEARQTIAELTNAGNQPDAQRYRAAIESSHLIQQMATHTLHTFWAVIHIVSDDPRKLLREAPPESLVMNKLEVIFGEPRTQFDLVSPYFVPGEDGTAMLTAWSKRGVHVKVLTNALEATDVFAVHSGYAKRRKTLLASGVTLYELRGNVPQPKGLTGPMGSSSASLHAKTFATDSTRIFVGSFNFDPRSALLNTEMGFIIDCPHLAQEMDRVFRLVIPQHAYEVHLSKDGDLYWTSQGVRYDTEPGSTLWRRTLVRVASWLPIEPLL